MKPTKEVPCTKLPDSEEEIVPNTMGEKPKSIEAVEAGPEAPFEKNRIFTPEVVEKARARLREKGVQFNGDPATAFSSFGFELKPSENETSSASGLEGAVGKFIDTIEDHDHERVLEEQNDMPDKVVLWVCPKCEAKCESLGRCPECENSSLEWAVNAAVRSACDRKVRSRDLRWVASVPVVGLFLILVWGIGDGGFSRLAGTESKPTSMATPTPVPMSEEERQILGAAKRYVSAKYPDWSFAGSKTGGFDDDMNYNEDVHLERGNESKVVRLSVGEFVNEDGRKYWVAFKTPRPTPSPAETPETQDTE